MQIKLTLAAAALLALAACGDTVGEQAAVGAGVGVVGAILTDGDPLTAGALGAAGNVAFCQANPDQCDDAGMPF